MRGIQKGHKDLAKITETLSEGWLREIDLKGKKEKALYQTLSMSLGLGEASSIAMAKVRGFIFACDDRTARREAGLLGVKLTGTLGLLKKATRDKIVNLEESDLILTRMKEKGFYSSVESLSEI